MKLLNSVGWVLGSQFVTLLLTIGTLAILGRLITPAEFGVFALIMAFQAFLLPLMDFGFTHVYLKLDDKLDAASSVFYTINIIFGSLGALVTIVLAPFLSDFYNVREMEKLLMIFSISFIFMSAKSQHQAVLNREKKFDILSKIKVFNNFTGSILVVFLAWMGYGVWSLIWRTIYEALISYFLIKKASKKRICLSGWGQILKYKNEIKLGFDILFAQLINGSLNALDNLIVGKFTSIDILGGYSRAIQFARLPDANIRNALTTPALVYLSDVKKNNILENYLLMSWAIFLLAGVPCILLISHGEILFNLILGDQWIGMGWMLQMLGLYGLARIYQGLFLIYNIDRKDAKRMSKYLLISLMAIYLLPTILIIEYKSIILFVSCFSIMAFIYWFMSCNLSIARDYPSYRKKILYISLKQFLVGVSSSAFTYLMGSILIMDAIYLKTIILIIFQVGLIGFLFVLFDPENAKKISRHVFEKR